MAYYEELRPILYRIVSERFLRNQDLCKLLYYYPENCEHVEDAYNFDPLSCEDIPNTNVLYMHGIYPMPKMPDAKDEKKAYLCAYLNGGYEVEDNLGYRNVTLNVDIVCHLDCWCIKEGFRVYDIMNQVDLLLNDQLTDLPIVNRPYLRGFQVRTYSDYFYGVQMLYNLKVNSNISCPVRPKMNNLTENMIYKYN